MTDGPTHADLLAVCTVACRFNEPGFVAGEWVLPAPSEDDVPGAGYWRASEEVARWQAALYEHHVVVPFDWTGPKWSQEMRRFTKDPSRLRRARLVTVRKVLTTLVRAERFCEGSLAVAFEAGVPQAAMRRLQRYQLEHLD